MKQFKVYLKTSDSKGRIIGTYNDFEKAVECGVEEVDRSHNSECKIARESLTKRMYYCIGYSEREVYIEEVDE